MPIDAPYRRASATSEPIPRRCGRIKLNTAARNIAGITMRSLCLSVVAVCGMTFVQRLGDVHADLVCVQLKPQDGRPTPVPALVRRRGKGRDDVKHPVKVCLRRQSLALSMWSGS